VEIQTLIKIQKLDLEMDELKKRARAIPAESAALDAELEEARAALHAAQTKLKELEKRQRHEELLLEDKASLLQKYDQQLFSVKTNKEYKAILSEMDVVKAEISSIEDTILEILTDIDYVKAELAAAEEALRAEETKVRDAKLRLESELEDVQRQLTDREQKKQALVPDVDEDLYELYERIRKAKKDGPAAVPVKNDSCAGCFMQIPPQVVNELIASDRLITCQSCSRILYWPDNVEE
jgi:predicted  nucleic acid-binding Zn-ribbon protein